MKQLKTILQSNIFYLILILITIIYVILSNFIIKNKSIYNLNNKTFYGTINSFKETEYGYSFIINKEEKLICYSKFFPYEIGDYIKVEGQLNIPSNNTVLNNYNYKNYLKHNGIYYILNVKDITLISKNKNIIYKIKNKILTNFNKLKSNAYLKTFIMGDTSYLDSNIYESFQENGISHLLSISSLSFSFLIYFIYKLLNKNKILKILSIIIIIIISFIFLIITNYNIVVIRIFLFFLLKKLNKMLKLNLSTLKVFIILISITLLINPNYIYHKGFLYSYGISFIIILNKNNLRGNYLTKLIKISFISFIYSIPFNIYFNYQINLLSIIYSIIYIPIFNFFVIPFSFIVIIIPKLDNLYFSIMNIVVKSSNLLNKVTFGIFILKKINIIILIIYVIIFTYTTYLFFKKKISLILIFLILIFHYNINVIIQNDYFIIIDVGQGDSSLFCSSNKCFLIDTGGLYNKNVSKESILMIKSLGIRKIEKMFLTHGDFDHMGDAIYFINHFKVSDVVLNNNNINELESDLIKELERKKIKYELGLKNNEYHFNNIYLKLLNYNLFNENDSSLVMYIIFNNKKILLMGDASSLVEDKLLKDYNLLDIDVLKVAHHGSRTGSSKKFINHINPKYSIISVGKNNKFGHPNKEVLNNLENSKIYRTDEDGSVMFTIKNNKLNIETCVP